MTLTYEVIMKRNQIKYCRHGKYHRVDGPAVIANYGSSYYLGVDYYRYGITI
jgi:hypothetical protein